MVAAESQGEEVRRAGSIGRSLDSFTSIQDREVSVPYKSETESRSESGNVKCKAGGGGTGPFSPKHCALASLAGSGCGPCLGRGLGREWVRGVHLWSCHPCRVRSTAQARIASGERVTRPETGMLRYSLCYTPTLEYSLAHDLETRVRAKISGSTTKQRILMQRKGID